MGVAGWGWDGLRNVAGKVVRNVAPVWFRGPGRLSRRNDVAYYLLKLEAAVRAAKEAATTASTSRFVPVTLQAGKAS